MANEELARLLDPDIVQRGAILPFGRTAAGETEFAVPEMVLELARALMLPGSVAKGEDFSEQDVTDMAMALAGTGGAVGTAPVGSLGIFAGRRATTANKAALRKAESMTAKGADRDDIWNETGWFKDVDGKWKFEIDDSAMTVDDLLARKVTASSGVGIEGEGSLIQHPELAAAYPEMSNIQHEMQLQGLGGSFREGHPYYGDPLMKVRGLQQEQRRGTTLHELQHAAQRQEGFATGGNVQEFATTPRMAEINAALPNAGSPAEYKSLLQEKLRLINENPNPMERYRRLAGEVESRNVEVRRDFTPEQRQAQPPWQTLDVPENELIVRMLAGGT